MKVIAVYEDNHGIVAIAKDYQAGVRYLLDNRWIDDDTEILGNDNKFHMIMDFIGPRWRERMFIWGIDRFNTLMGDQFSMIEVEVYE